MKPTITIIGCLSSILVFSPCAYSATAGTKSMPLKVTAPMLRTRVLPTPVNVALESIYTDKPLAGVKGVTVYVESVSQNAKQDGIDPDQIKIAIELRLRRNGITVFDKISSDSSGSMASLDININAVKNKQEVYGYGVQTDLLEVVSLLRPTVCRTAATTWTTGDTGTASADSMASIVHQHVDDEADRFANDYLAQNPK